MEILYKQYKLYYNKYNSKDHTEHEVLTKWKYYTNNANYTTTSTTTKTILNMKY